MLLNIYIATIIITIICFLGAEYSMKRDCKKRYTKDQIKYVGANFKKNGNPITNILIFVCPVINIMFALVYTFGYEQVIKKTFEVTDKILTTYKEPGEGDNANGR